MYLELDEQQQALTGLARDVLADVAGPDRLRGDGAAPSHDAWKQLAAPGLTGLGIPESEGGSGGDEVDVAVVLEQAGAALLPEPLRETCGVVAPLLVRHGADAQRERLGAVAAGQQLLGTALGSRRLLPAASVVDAVLVVEDARCLLVPRERCAIEPLERATDPSRDLGRVTAVDAEDGDELVGAHPDEARARGAAATASALVGVAQRLLDVAVDHAAVREQFGTPIGAFQAVAHPLVDVDIAVETARAAAWYAALRLRDRADDAHGAARVAKAAADDAAALADRVALQVLGGIGFTWEHELHLLSKRATAWRAAFGDARAHQRALGAGLLAG